jgi:hypothetical protein
VTVTLSSSVIGFIDTSVNPSVTNSINGALSQSSVKVSFAKPFVRNDLVGLRMDLDLRHSLQNESHGITGVVNSVFEMALLGRMIRISRLKISIVARLE